MSAKSLFSKTVIATVRHTPSRRCEASIPSAFARRSIVSSVAFCLPPSSADIDVRRMPDLRSSSACVNPARSRSVRRLCAKTFRADADAFICECRGQVVQVFILSFLFQRGRVRVWFSRNSHFLRPSLLSKKINVNAASILCAASLIFERLCKTSPENLQFFKHLCNDCAQFVLT